MSDYSEDVALLSEIFPWLDDEINVTDNERYVQLRDLGLSAKEAFLAIGAAVRKPDNRSHLISSVPKSAAAPRSQMTRSELECARSIFEGMDELEIKRLYKKVTK